jgi:hypothetical protein
MMSKLPNCTLWVASFFDPLFKVANIPSEIYQNRLTKPSLFLGNYRVSGTAYMALTSEQGGYCIDSQPGRWNEAAPSGNQWESS